MLYEDMDETVEALHNEDKWDEGRKYFLSESGEKFDERAAFEANEEEADETHPETDPSPNGEELPAFHLIALAKLKSHRW